jgi:hypothetical protein
LASGSYSLHNVSWPMMTQSKKIIFLKLFRKAHAQSEMFVLLFLHQV